MKVPAKLLANPSFMIDLTAKDSHNHFEEEMGKLDLSRGEWMALAELYYCEGASQKELADLLGLGESSSGKITQKLQAGGWVVRQPSATDRRAFNLYLAKDRRPVVAKLVKLLTLHSDRALKGFSKEERAMLVGYLQRIRMSISDTPKSTQWHGLKAELLLDVDRIKGQARKRGGAS